MADECKCSPDVSGRIIHNSWAHPEWRTPEEQLLWDIFGTDPVATSVDADTKESSV